MFHSQDIYAYCVSPFMLFACYGGAHTYICNAAIRSPEKNNEVVGGIGIVFDSTVEFGAILNDILPRENGVVKAGTKALFTTDKGFVIASSSDHHVVGSVFFPD